MQQKSGTIPSPKRAADLIKDAGGKVVGRTRLQKMAYFLEVAGLGDGFEFAYRHYGPYSEELSQAVRRASLFGLLSEEVHAASWGGSYSIYSSNGQSGRSSSKTRKELMEAALNCDPVALELAATALFLRREGVESPWLETARRKPEKVEGDMLVKAQELYSKLRALQPKKLPELS